MTDNLITLADVFADHIGVKHHAISMRLLGKGDFFQSLKNQGDCRTKTAERVLQGFADCWPDDLEWPQGIPRPEARIKANDPGG